MKKKLLIVGLIILILIATIGVFAFISFISTNNKQNTYEKNGDFYYDYRSNNENGYEINVNVNKKKEISRKLILDEMQEIKMRGKGYDYGNQTFTKCDMILPKAITDYYYRDDVKSIIFTLQNATGRLTLKDSENEEVEAVRFNGLKYITNDSLEYNIPEKFLCMEMYITSNKAAPDNYKDKIKEIINNLIIRAEIIKDDATPECHYIKFELANEYVDRFVYVYELNME